MDQIKQSEYMVHVYKILLYVHTYVCTSPTTCAYVCMYEILLYLRMYCMYKILLYLCMYVCMYKSYCMCICMYEILLDLRMYVWDSSVCMRFYCT